MDENKLLSLFCSYMSKSDIMGEPFLDGIYIKSNKDYIFFGEPSTIGKIFAMFSKKYLLTIEFKKNELLLNKIACITDFYRSLNGLTIQKYEFWIPSCLVNDVVIPYTLIAESYGISRALALEYLIEFDFVFKKLYNSKKAVYFGLPLLSSLEEAEKYILKDNTKAYLAGLKKVTKYKNLK